MSAQKPTFTVFGATGGCAANALVPALNASLTCVAMVRTPAKLRTMLETQYNVPAAKIDACLTIVQGNITSTDDIKAALTVGGHLPDRILFGVGGAPHLQFSLFEPCALDNPRVCEQGMEALVSALRSCAAENFPLGPTGSKPIVISISTTGIGRRRDVPLLMYPLYHWVLRGPHQDKGIMEKILTTTANETDSPVGDFAVVRPTLLNDSPAQGLAKVRAGWVWADVESQDKLARGEKEKGPEMGYSISRIDVGSWIFDKLVIGDGMYGRCSSLTT